MSKRTKPNVGEIIEVSWRPVFSTKKGFNPVDAEVLDVLAVQFTCLVDVDGKPLSFQFYHNQGDSWRFKE
jgi:hypothetical protein